ncbi:MAG: hypothetical protein K9J13_10760 [Saprospiraceae bacterium]|nr:hypothetical protein [Saprospiraceae bacterium]
MEAKVLSRGSESFYKYLDNCKDHVKSKSSEGYYPVNVVAEAYSQGFSDGEKSGQKEFIERIIANEIEKFTQKANQIYILSQNVISYLKEEGYNSISLHINLQPNRPSVILSVPDDILINDDFVDKAYTKIHENRNIFLKLFNEQLDIGIIGNNNLNKKLLLEDGFGYTEEY